MESKLRRVHAKGSQASATMETKVREANISQSKVCGVNVREDRPRRQRSGRLRLGRTR